MVIIEYGKIYNHVDRYAHIADCMDEIATDMGIVIRWGAVWDKFLTDYDDAQREFQEYTKRLRAVGRRPFVDAVHFELHPYEVWNR